MFSKSRGTVRRAPDVTGGAGPGAPQGRPQGQSSKLDLSPVLPQKPLGPGPRPGGTGEHAAALAIAEELSRLGWDPATDSYDAACAFAQCIPHAEKNAKLPAAERQKQAKAYADRAMELLRQAVAAGYKDAAHMQKDKDLDPLRDREDFKKLLAELEAIQQREAKKP